MAWITLDVYKQPGETWQDAQKLHIFSGGDNIIFLVYKTDIIQQLLYGLPGNVVQTFKNPRGWILVIPWLCFSTTMKLNFMILKSNWTNHTESSLFKVKCYAIVFLLSVDLCYYKDEIRSLEILSVSVWVLDWLETRKHKQTWLNTDWQRSLLNCI